MENILNIIKNMEEEFPAHYGESYIYMYKMLKEVILSVEKSIVDIKISQDMYMDIRLEELYSLKKKYMQVLQALEEEVRDICTEEQFNFLTK